MGKKNKRNRRRSQAARMAANFTVHTHQELLNDAIKYESSKEEQMDYVKRVNAIEKDMLSRTIFVSGVKDLRNNYNLQLLRIFFEGYGPVEACFASDYGKQRKGRSNYPPARVRFRNLDDFNKVMAACDSNGLLYCSSVGTINRSMIKVGKSNRYENISKGILEGSVIQFAASALALGHWTREDILETWQKESTDLELLDKSEMDKAEWLEETQLYGSNDLGVQINLSTRKIELSMTYSTELFSFHMDAQQYATFRFKEVDGMIELCRCNDENGSKFSLIFSLKYPPRLEQALWDPDNEDKRRKRCLHFGNVSADNFGNCLSVRLSLPDIAVQTLLLESEGMTKLQDFGMFSRKLMGDSRNLRDISITKIGKMENDRKAIASFEALHQHNARIGVGFSLRALIDQAKFCWYHALHDKHHFEGDWFNIFDIIKRYPPFVVCKTLEQILKACGKTKFPCRLFCKLVYDDIEELKTPAHCVSIPRLLLTPSRQVSLPFEVEMSNRVVRKFVEEEGFTSESFVRVQIGDENGEKIFPSDITPELESRIKKMITSGIKVNGRLYLFLAYSSSQLKEGSVWMVFPERTWTIKLMRSPKIMGDFSGCKSPSKYAARIGQCFSTTFQGLSGRDGAKSSEFCVKHEVVSDLVSAHENVPHSDGNGLISKQVLDRLLKKLPNASQRVIYNTSVVQIRYGGAKGILVAWDSNILDDMTRTFYRWNRRSYDVILRNSMIKFDAPFRFLEVCRVGTHVPYYLNRNVILLLVTHQVTRDTFMTLQSKMLKDLELMLSNREKAIGLLPSLGGPDQRQRMRLLHVLYSGLSPKTDPFLFACCVSIRSHHLYGLRKKARIFIDRGAVLIGGVDETKRLPEFCVFLQVRKSVTLYNGRNDDEFEPIVGPVMVTKHPVMHPGDVRMLLAVDIPELRDHKNVLLFSQHGDRPEPNKMAGSDLDGDEYAVTWDPQLFLGEWNKAEKRCDGKIVSQKGRILSFTNTTADALSLQHSNFEPLDYSSSASSAPEMKNIGDDELVQHFINYAKNDCLGRIGMLWQDWAAKKGANCRECIELSRLHSIAVDFAKTGVPATIPDSVKWKGSVAHWREKKDKESHHCNSIIGNLYDAVLYESKKSIILAYQDGLAGRKVDTYGQVLSVIEKNPTDYLRKNYQARIPSKLGWLNEGGEHASEQLLLISFANEQRCFYDEQLMEVMNKYHLRNEGELFTGCIRKYHKLHKKRQHEVSEEIRRQCNAICDEYRTLFFQKVLEMSRIEDESLDILIQEMSELTLKQGDKASGEANEDEVEREQLLWAEKIATSKDHANDVPRSIVIQKNARKLAAAYYIVTYAPWREWDGQPYALFSFPWVVADVIACGTNDVNA